MSPWLRSRKMVDLALSAAEGLEAEGVNVEVIDPRSLSPLDGRTIVDSVEKTGRLVIVDEDTPRCNLATDIAALAADEAFYSLEAPIKRVTPPHTPVPFSPALENAYIPSEAPGCDSDSGGDGCMKAVVFPKSGLITEQGTLLQWTASEGDRVEEGQLCARSKPKKPQSEVTAPYRASFGRYLSPRAARGPWA